MPSRKKNRIIYSKRTRKFNSNKKYKRNRNWGFQSNITSSQLTELNEILHNKKSATYKRKESWKLVPKDSCEVYKDRRKRQLDAERRKQEKNHDESDQDTRTEFRNYRRTRRRCERCSRRRSTRSSSSYSTVSCCTSCSSYMDYE